MKHTGKVQAVLAFLILGGFLGVVWLFISRPVTVSETAKDIVLILIGQFSGMAATIVAYFFGSSSGSARKDELMGASRGGPPNPPTA